MSKENKTATRWPPTPQEDAAPVTREQYVEMLIDAWFRDALEMEAGFLSWCERHVPVWRERGYDEMWIRQRIEMAQSTRGLHRTLKQQGLTMLEIREELRKMYADAPELYDQARERERLHPGLLRYRGNTSDLRQRYTLRVLLYETDKLAYEQFCRWSGLPVPDPESVFCEQPNAVRVVRDLSTVEELEMMLTMSQYALHLFEAPQRPVKGQIVPLLEARGQQLRAAFIARHGYRPEESAMDETTTRTKSRYLDGEALLHHHQRRPLGVLRNHRRANVLSRSRRTGANHTTPQNPRRGQPV